MGGPDDQVVRLREGSVVWRQVGDEVMVLDTAKSEYLSVNPTGTVLWPLLSQGVTVTTLAEALVSAFDIDPAVAARDARAFVGSLAERDLLEPPTDQGA